MAGWDSVTPVWLWLVLHPRCTNRCRLSLLLEARWGQCGVGAEVQKTAENLHSVTDLGHEEISYSLRWHSGILRLFARCRFVILQACIWTYIQYEDLDRKRHSSFFPSFYIYIYIHTYIHTYVTYIYAYTNICNLYNLKILFILLIAQTPGWSS